MLKIKIKCHLLYDELKILLWFTNFWKEITINFIINLLFNKWKKVVYNLILMIVNHYIKIMHYLSMKKTLIIIKLTKLFFKEVALRYEISNDIIIDKDNLFINVFWLKVCFHVKIKWRLNTVFHSQTDD